MKGKRIGTGGAWIGALLSCLLVWFCFGFGAAEAKPGTVNVGYYPIRGFHAYDAAGNPAGYNVDYLKQIAKYTGWNYKYVRAKDIGEAIEMLDTGEIDLLGGVLLSSKTAAWHSYAAYSNGSTYGALLALRGNASLTYEDFAKFSGLRVGVTRNSFYLDTFLAYARLHGFSAEPIVYDSMDDMRGALRAREIDAMLCNIMAMEEDEKSVANFAPTSFYYIAGRENGVLLEQLNEALSQIKINEPHLEEELQAKYYAHLRQVPFSQQELDYIAAHPVIRVGCLTTRPPISYRDDETGALLGIVRDVTGLIGKNSGLRFEYVPVPEGMSPAAYLRDGAVDMVTGIVRYDGRDDASQVMLSRPFLKGKMLLCGRKGAPFSSALPVKVALSSGFDAAAHYMRMRYPHFEIVFYENARQCMDAVKSGEADFVLQNSYVLGEFLQNPVYRELAVVPTVEMDEPLCVGLQATADPLLLAVLNKTIQNLFQAEVDQCVIRHTLSSPYRITLRDFFIEYRMSIFLIAILLCLALGALWYAQRQRQKNLRSVIENERKLSNITNNINGGVIILIPDTGFTITYANKGFLSLIGYTREEYEMRQRQGNGIITYVHPEDIPMLNRTIGMKLEDGQTIHAELRILHKTEGFVPVLFRGTFSHEETQGALFFCVVVDISAQRRMINALEVEKERYRVILEQSDDIIFDLDEGQRNCIFSAKFKEKFGWNAMNIFYMVNPAEEMRIYAEDIPLAHTMVQLLRQGERYVQEQMRIQKADGDYICCLVQANRISKPNAPLKVVGKIADIDAQIKEHDRLKRLSQRDALTGLYNKAAVRAAVESFLENRHTPQEAALLFIDLDHFKEINDRLGHMVGDQVLKDVADKLRAIFREEDSLARFGGDEFVVFARKMPMPVLHKKAEQVLEALRIGYGSETNGVRVSASIGGVCYSGESMTYDEMLERADTALYRAKKCGRDTFVLYNGGLS